MSFLDAFKKGPETVGDLKRKQRGLQKDFETEQANLQQVKKAYTVSKGKLMAFNSQYGQVLRLVEGE